MTNPSMLFADSPEPEPEPEVFLEPEPEAWPDPEPEPEPAPVSLAPVPLMDVLPADFALPALIRFVPDVRRRVAIEQASTYALSLDVSGAEGLQRADVALAAVKAAIKAAEDDFAEPCDTANQLHKRLTGLRGEWTSPGKAAIDVVGRRIWTEDRRLKAIAEEERRQQQQEEDRKARERARAEAEAAAKAQAPAPVVEQLKRQAETASAPPVERPASAPPKLQNTSVVATWKARFKDDSGSPDPNPELTALSAGQQLQAFHLIVNVAAQLARDLRLTLEPEYLTKCVGAPLASLALDWSYLHKRAKADKTTLQIPGIEAYEDGGTRSRGSRARVGA